MKILVSYRSRTGFTEEYAGYIAEKLGADIMELDEGMKVMDDYDIVIYGGGFYAGRINGLDKALAACADRMVVFATGAAADSDERVGKMFGMNLKGRNIPHFYMRGGLRYDRMRRGDRLMMKIAARAMNGKSDMDLTRSFEGSKMEYADELIDFVRNMDI